MAVEYPVELHLTLGEVELLSIALTNVLPVVQHYQASDLSMTYTRDLLFYVLHRGLRQGTDERINR